MGKTYTRPFLAKRVAIVEVRLFICFRRERCQLTSERPIGHDLDRQPWVIAIQAHFRKYLLYIHTLSILFSNLQILQRDYTENVKFSHLSILAPPGLLVRNRKATARRWTRLLIISAANEPLF